MNVLVVGSGGREHALVWKISQSKQVNRIYCAPGNAGTSENAENIAISADDVNGLLEFAKSNDIGLTVVGPEIPLVAGIVDVFESNGLKVFGPNKDASQMEGSKIFCKDLLLKYSIPTAEYGKFTNADEAISYVKQKGAPIVVKADGLAAGKGVTVAMTEDEAIDAITQIMQEKVFGDAGASVVVEEFMQGEEASILAFCDGKSVVAMSSAQDHKAIYDGDKGPNTGGMGAYSPAPVVTKEMERVIQDTILVPTLNALKSEGINYKGVLYAGLMMTTQGPKIVEYNVRFGDPETQIILPRMKNDIIDVFMAVIDEKLDQVNLEWEDKSAICVVMAAPGYPASYKKGMVISGLDTKMENTMVFHAGTTLKDNAVVTSGGRVLNVTSVGSDLKEAFDNVYADIKNIDFDGAYYRKDIGAKGLKR